MKILLGLAAFVLIIGGIMWYRKSTWKVLAIASSQYSDDIKENYKLLRNRNIRCKIESVAQEYEIPISNHPASHFASYTPPESSIQLLVHKKDLEEAQHIVDES